MKLSLLYGYIRDVYSCKRISFSSNHWLFLFILFLDNNAHTLKSFIRNGKCSSFKTNKRNLFVIRMQNKNKCSNVLYFFVFLWDVEQNAWSTFVFRIFHFIFIFVSFWSKRKAINLSRKVQSWSSRGSEIKIVIKFGRKTFHLNDSKQVFNRDLFSLKFCPCKNDLTLKYRITLSNEN